MSENRGKEASGLTARARIVATATSGADPTIMLTGPTPAAKKALKQAGWYTTDQILWRPERQGAYRPFTTDDRTALEARFAEHGLTLDRQ